MSWKLFYHPELEKNALLLLTTFCINYSLLKSAVISACKEKKITLIGGCDSY